MSLLCVNNLNIHFHTQERIVKAVNDVSFELNQNETLGIVGESGSGKSVLCYSLLQLLPSPPAKITGGTATFNGVDLLTASETTLRKIRGNTVSIIFQDPMTSLTPYMTIGEQLIEPLRTHKKISRPEAYELAIQALREVDIAKPDKQMSSYPHEFSGGMRQRVMIAMALITKPDILIADEPTTALDVTVQVQILTLIQRLRDKQNLSVIFVTHDLGVIAGIADNILVMREGEVVEAGDANKIFYHPQHSYTKRMLDAVPHSGKDTKFKYDSKNTEDIQLKIENLNTHFPISKTLLFSKKSEYIKAVDNVSIHINCGEVLGLAGESGSGKSTLARSIMRLVHINSGSILLSEKNLVQLNEKELNTIRPKFQMIFQDPYSSLNPRMTVYQTLAEAIRIRGKQTSDTIAKEVSQLVLDVGLEPLSIRKYPHEFSGGQRQRIAIARALALRPQLIIADEPVSSLDVTIQAQILELLLKLMRQWQLTMIFISHDLSVIRFIADRTAIMLQGKIVELNETEALFNQPQHAYTKSLLSAIPIPDPIKQRARYESI